jgi:hypothetical protein
VHPDDHSPVRPRRWQARAPAGGLAGIPLLICGLVPPGRAEAERRAGYRPRSQVAAFKAATSACKPLLPSLGTLSPALQAAARAQPLKYSRCMRAHGISDFPDPDAQGGIALSPKPGGDLEPHNPRFQAANQACQHYQPGKGGSVSTSTSGGSGGGS